MEAATRLLLVVALLLPAACVSTSYGPIGKDAPYGYIENKRADGTYMLRVVHPSFTEAQKFWDKRAVELCGSADYKKNIYMAIMPTQHYAYYGGRPGEPQIEGLLTCIAPVAEAPPATPTP